MYQSIQQTDKILRINAVQEMTGNPSRATLWRWEKAGLFPRRVKLGARAMGWKLSEIQEWIKSRGDEQQVTPDQS